MATKPSCCLNLVKFIILMLEVEFHWKIFYWWELRTLGNMSLYLWDRGRVKTASPSLSIRKQIGSDGRARGSVAIWT